MAGVSRSKINLFDQYSIPTNNHGYYFCRRCEYDTRRDRTKWIKHIKQCDPDEFNAILESIRVLNSAVESIIDDPNQAVQSDIIDGFE